VRDKVVPTLNVRAALAAVESENVDAGIVYRTDAALSKRVRVAFEVPPELGPKIVYPLAPIAASRKAGTRDFVRYLVSPDAIQIYERHGFRVLIGR
jgi:molybdate transport system substrate-binding protein